MIYPTIKDLSKDQYNRYEVALATAKCARIITNEYVRQRLEAEAAASGSKDSDKPVNAMIDREFRDEKAVKIAINRIYEGKYEIVHKDPDEQERAEKEILSRIMSSADRSMRRDEEAFAEEKEEENADEETVDVAFEGDETADEN
jgi:DNA-directed RNA polymerase subunit K/omega